MPSEDDSQNVPLTQSADWGSIDAVVNAPLIGVPADAMWLSVLGMWLLLPINLIQAVIGGLCQSAFVWMSYSSCFSGYQSTLKGRPYWMSFVWWRYMLAGLVALAANRMSRLALFLWEKAAFGNGEYWWHGEGIWCGSYDLCDQILKSSQERRNAFGCVQAAIPDLFADKILIFLSNSGMECEWAALSKAVHHSFLNTSSQHYKDRMSQLPAKLAEDWPDPKLSDMKSLDKVQSAVCRCVFFLMFGVWLPMDDVKLLFGWRRYGTFFILPRLIQRFLLNIGIILVKRLRVNTVGIIEKHGLKEVFVKMNASLPEEYQRDQVVKLCDEIMFVIGFAGIGGTCACVESVGSFLHAEKPNESASDSIDLGKYKTSADMVAAYRDDPVAYIKEMCRLDPPVTSATSVVKSDMTIQLAGRSTEIPKGMLRQYTVSVANRDPKIFPDPQLFNPKRENLNKALTWNGAFGSPNDAKLYPRLCPGRYLSLDITQAIVNYAISKEGKDGP